MLLLKIIILLQLIHTYSFTFIHSFIHSFIHFIYLLIYLHTYILTFLLTYWLTYVLPSYNTQLLFYYYCVIILLLFTITGYYFAILYELDLTIITIIALLTKHNEIQITQLYRYKRKRRNWPWWRGVIHFRFTSQTRGGNLQVILTQIFSQLANSLT